MNRDKLKNLLKSVVNHNKTACPVTKPLIPTSTSSSTTTHWNDKEADEEAPIDEFVVVKTKRNESTSKSSPIHQSKRSMLNNFKNEEIDYGKEEAELYSTVRKAPRSKIQLDDCVIKKSKSKGEISGRKKASSKDESSLSWSKATNSRRNKNEQSKTTSNKSSMADESLKSREVVNYLKFLNIHFIQF